MDNYHPEMESREDRAVSAREAEVEAFHDKCRCALEHVQADDARSMANLFGCSTNLVNRLAQVFATFPEELQLPDIPTSLYGAALDTDAPVVWLERALAEGWSSRELRDAADVAKGRRTSRVLWLNCEADVKRENGAITLRPRNQEPSGETPAVAKVKVWEVLEMEGTP